MNKTRTINLHLLTGNPLGGKIISFSNRTILGISFSRKDFDVMKNRKELTRSGVYFLIGDNENSEPVAYIGQATTILNRIISHYHDTEKDYWNYVVAFTTTDNSFTETDINFLERKLIEIGKNTERYKIENRTNGNNSLTNEFRISDLIEYIDDLKILLSSLGFQVLQETISEEDKREEYVGKTKGFTAKGYYTEEGFLVLKGSEGPKKIQPSVQKNKGYSFRKRPLFEEQGIIKIEEDKIIFLKDYLFLSPTASAELISGASINGWEFWKTKDGKTLDEVERKK